jgi:hypothetical protein
MVQKGAIRDTIKTYVIGGEPPSGDLPGNIPEEKEILAMADSEKIDGVLFNEADPTDDNAALSVVLTKNCVFVGKKDLFPVTGEQVGRSIFMDNAS